MVGYEFSEAYHERAIERARSRGGGLIRIHTQPGGVRESSIDTASAARVYENDRDRLLAALRSLQPSLMMLATGRCVSTNPRATPRDDPEITRADRVRVVGPATDEPALDVRPTGRRNSDADRVGVASGEQDSTIQLWGTDGRHG